MKSPIKWVGGKKSEIKYFEKYIPKYTNYVEPFFGGGALFWYLKPKNGTINDINDFLIDFYIELRDNYDGLTSSLQLYENNKEFYNNIVNKINNKSWNNRLEKATMFYYINKTCFSGKWRVNSKGLFNNTFGNYQKDNFKIIEKKYSDYLKDISIENKDYKTILKKFKEDENSFIFLDPPYLDCDNMYTESQDFVEIYEYISVYMRESKSKVMLVVKDGNKIRELFDDLIFDTYSKNYRHNAISKVENTHLIITNYKIN